MPPEAPARAGTGLVAALVALRDQVGDPLVLAMVRVGFGLLLLNEAWLATQQLRGAGFFGGHFHQPMLPEALVPGESVYTGILAVQWAAAVAILAGRAARPALIVAASLLVYGMLCDRLWFHHYRHTMAAFSLLLAMSPCDRELVVGRAPVTGPAPLWAANAMKAQVSVMYLSSGGSKLFDPDWRGGLMMRGMVAGFARLVRARGVPSEWIDALQTPLGGSLLAKGAIATELSLALLLWWPRARRWAIWVGLFFHLSISLMTPVQLFTFEMLLVYLLFATPDREGRVLRFDAERHPLAGVVESNRLAEALSLRARGGRPLRGGRSRRARARRARRGRARVRDGAAALPGLARRGRGRVGRPAGYGRSARRPCPLTRRSTTMRNSPGAIGLLRCMSKPALNAAVRSSLRA